MAVIEKRAPGQWRAKIRKKGYPVQSKTFATRAKAETWARGMETDMDRGRFTSTAEAERTTLKEALDRYEQEVTPHKKGAKQEGYRVSVWRRSPLANRTLASLRSTDFAQWRDARRKDGYSPSTIRNDLNLISHMFNIARMEWGFDGLLNPITSIRKPALPQGRDRRLEDGEEERLMAACEASKSTWLKPLVIFAIESAMRAGEIMSLEWKNVDLERSIAHLPDTKNNTPRTVSLTPGGIRVLKKLPRSITGKVFAVRQDSVLNAFRRAVKEAGLKDLRFHDLRHEATSRFFEAGVEPMQVRSITGHKTMNMLARYTHINAERLAKELAEKMG